MTTPLVRPRFTPPQARLVAGFLAAMRDGGETEWLAGRNVRELRLLLAALDRVEDALDDVARTEKAPARGDASGPVTEEPPGVREAKPPGVTTREEKSPAQRQVGRPSRRRAAAKPT